MYPEQCIYVGKIMHTRLKPMKNIFKYSVFSLLLDLDNLTYVASKSRILKINKFGLLSFYEKDHGARDGSNLRIWVDKKLKNKFRPQADKVFLLSFPRMYGYGFSPLSVYFCYTGEDLTTVLYEVKNTFGDQIIYVLPAKEDNDGAIRHRHPKEMYVSPFLDMEQEYNFTLLSPGQKLSIRIKEYDTIGNTLIATQHGRYLKLNDRGLLKCIVTHPLMTIKVILAIHWHAIGLFLKGIKYIPYSDKLDIKNKTK